MTVRELHAVLERIIPQLGDKPVMIPKGRHDELVALEHGLWVTSPSVPAAESFIELTGKLPSSHPGRLF